MIITNHETGNVFTAKIYPKDIEEIIDPMFEFTVQPNNKFIVYEKKGHNVKTSLDVEQKRWMRTWVTKSGYNVNPHSRMKRNSGKCHVCPY